MSSKAATSEGSAAVTAKLPVLMLLIVVILGVCLGMAGVGGGVYMLVKSGKLPLGNPTSIEPAPTAGDKAGHPVVLEPILVNLADEGGHAYLRLGLTLDVEGDAPKSEAGDGKSGKAPNEQELAVRDTVLAVLGQQTSAWLLGPDGKEHLKTELKEALAKHNGQMKIKDLFFTDFLVQI